MATARLNQAQKANPIGEPETTWDKFEIAQWKVGGLTYKFPVRIVEEDGGNRLVLRARPYRPGVKIDSTGGKEKGFTLSSLFWNGCKEPGLDPTMKLYPDVLHGIIESFDIQETGDLIVPSRGRKRARANTYRKTETAEGEWDAAAATFNFVTDNEEEIGQANVSPMTARTSGPKIARNAQFDADNNGIGGDGGLPALIDSMNQLRGVIEAPGVFIEDARSNARAIARNVEKIIDSFSDATEPARSMFLDPDAHRLVRKLNILKDAAFDSDVTNPSNGQRRAVGQRTFATNRSIFQIAADIGQDPLALSDLNQYRIDDLNNIEAGTVVRVYV